MHQIYIIMRQIPQTRASVHVLTNHTVVPLISFSDFNTIILCSCSVWLFNGNISPFLIKPSLITPSSPSLLCFQPPFFSRGSIIKLISDEEMFWSVSFSSRSIIPPSKWWKVGLQCRQRHLPPPKPPPSPFFPLHTDLLFQQNIDAKWMSGASAAWNPLAVQQRSVAGVFSGCRFHTDCSWGTEPRCQIHRSCSVAKKLLTMMSSQLASPQHDHSVMALPKSKPLVNTATGSVDRKWEIWFYRVHFWILFFDKLCFSLFPAPICLPLPASVARQQIGISHAY